MTTPYTDAHVQALAAGLERIVGDRAHDVGHNGIWVCDEGRWRKQTWNDVAIDLLDAMAAAGEEG